MAAHRETYKEAANSGMEALESLVSAYEAAGDRLQESTTIANAV